MLPLALASLPPQHLSQQLPQQPPQLDRLMLFGFLSAFLVFTCWALVRYSRPARLMLAICLMGQAVFGFLAGAWPLGFTALLAAAVAARWWWRDAHVAVYRNGATIRHPKPAASEARRALLFGSQSDAQRYAENN
jgi:hypothetical protein